MVHEAQFERLKTPGDFMGPEYKIAHENFLQTAAFVNTMEEFEEAVKDATVNTIVINEPIHGEVRLEVAKPIHVRFDESFAIDKLKQPLVVKNFTPCEPKTKYKCNGKRKNW